MSLGLGHLGSGWFSWGYYFYSPLFLRRVQGQAESGVFSRFPPGSERGRGRGRGRGGRSFLCRRGGAGSPHPPGNAGPRREPQAARVVRAPLSFPASPCFLFSACGRVNADNALVELSVCLCSKYRNVQNKAGSVSGAYRLHLLLLWPAALPHGDAGAWKGLALTLAGVG